MKKLIYGVGINDADYVVRPTVNGREVWCPFYAKWKAMIERCYCSKKQAARPTYIGCSVYPEWLIFSNFKKWAEQQDWEGKELDKDLLFQGNKVYSPNTCVFVDAATNTFANEYLAGRGACPLGVYFEKSKGKFRAKCQNPFTLKSEHLGYFTCPDEAHQVWKKRKHELACQLAEIQTDKRVAEALRKRYI